MEKKILEEKKNLEKNYKLLKKERCRKKKERKKIKIKENPLFKAKPNIDINSSFIENSSEDVFEEKYVSELDKDMNLSSTYKANEGLFEKEE